MGLESILILFFATKHLIFDWWLQSGWMAFNKHRFDHWGGYAHAGLNVIGTVFALLIFALVMGPFPAIHHTTYLVPLLLVGEFVSHFFMDLVKMRVTKWRKWDMTKDPQFWHWTGFDQWVHMIYLIFMAGMLV